MFRELTAIEQELLTKQSKAMAEYLAVLDHRISSF